MSRIPPDFHFMITTQKPSGGEKVPELGWFFLPTGQTRDRLPQFPAAPTHGDSAQFSDGTRFGGTAPTELAQNPDCLFWFVFIFSSLLSIPPFKPAQTDRPTDGQTDRTACWSLLSSQDFFFSPPSPAKKCVPY